MSSVSNLLASISSTVSPRGERQLVMPRCTRTCVGLDDNCDAHDVHIPRPTRTGAQPSRVERMGEDGRLVEDHDGALVWALILNCCLRNRMITAFVEFGLCIGVGSSHAEKFISGDSADLDLS